MSINNVEELREFLAIELERLRTGTTTPASASASANIAGKMIASVKMELDYNKMVGANPSIGFLGKSKMEKLNHQSEDDKCIS
jgi:hypothetical protein